MTTDYSFALTESAASDLDDIYAYISYQLQNPVAALNFLNDFEEQADDICRIPKSGRLVTNEYLHRDDVRRFLVNNYTAYYICDDGARSVIILRVVYSAMDQDKILKTL